MKINRREFIGSTIVAGALTTTDFAQSKKTNQSGKIDRFALVSRHNPVLNSFEIMSPLSVGNGEFAFTCDATGLQTFPELYREKFPLCTMSQWGWHTITRPANLVGKELILTEYDTYGRKVGYHTHTQTPEQKQLFDWLRQNPHRLHLGQIGLKLTKADGSEAKPDDIKNILQKLDLWTGIITSKFEFEGKSVLIKTCVHPEKDVLSVSIDSELISQNKLAVKIDFPYGSPDMHAADWDSSNKHTSQLRKQGKMVTRIYRELDEDEYSVGFVSNEELKIIEEKQHHFILKGNGVNLDFSVHFNKSQYKNSIIYSSFVSNESSKFWKNFWTNGAAIDLAETNDKRAKELERRIVLSQYLTAINCSGSLPPAETGITTNSWYGKFHLEMHWWHSAQFALWNRLPMLEKSLDWYLKVLPSARERAVQQGYKGVRWAKMTEPEGRDAPSPIGPLLIWQQPHPIFYAELVYLTKPTKTTLKKFQQMVEETAAFMADFAYFDAKTNRYILGPPVIPAQENHPSRETWNPTYELEYWRYGLNKANEWRERLGLKRNKTWDEVVSKLSKLPEKDGVYLSHENCPQTFTERNIDHPSMLAAFGVLNGETVDKETMRRTLHKVMKEWTWADTWGWDYPMTAMTAAKLGETELAVDALLLDTPKNHYEKNGHNYQRPNLPLYLPGNGGLLYAIALMAAGWKGSPQRNTPGFPSNWKIKVENFNFKLNKEM